MGRPSRLFGGIAALVSILGFFGITQWSDLFADDKREVDASDEGGGSVTPEQVDPPDPTPAPPPPTTTSVEPPPPETTEPESPIAFGITIDLDDAVEIYAVARLSSGHEVELHVDPSQPHDEAWIELECDCRLGYELQTTIVVPGELGPVEVAGYGTGELEVEDGDVAFMTVVDWTTEPWQVALVE